MATSPGTSSNLSLPCGNVTRLSFSRVRGLFWYRRFVGRRHFSRSLTMEKVTSPNPSGCTRIGPQDVQLPVGRLEDIFYFLKYDWYSVGVDYTDGFHYPFCSQHLET
ncbi:hypothetical protein AVEN_94901-1 [Araneus ventricosus]|uniref:Uncharacterized protein n=1 Tax=Araneus ventricosus TaxID=182803 RepID=A0A4Y2NI07_ARAVE|nr:hypothetical protein AVEN_94901-1 [Araneus ventricosus]